MVVNTLPMAKVTGLWEIYIELSKVIFKLISVMKSWGKWNCPPMDATGPYWLCVNIGSGNGLVLLSNKPLHEPQLTQFWPYGISRPQWLNTEQLSSFDKLVVKPNITINNENCHKMFNENYHKMLIFFISKINVYFPSAMSRSSWSEGRWVNYNQIM